jgi:Cu+-exporting ATPase
MGKASIDYSFVTGESLPSDKGIGEIIYAGGKQVGGAIELEVVKESRKVISLNYGTTKPLEKKRKRKSFVCTPGKPLFHLCIIQHRHHNRNLLESG